MSGIIRILKLPSQILNIRRISTTHSDVQEIRIQMPLGKIAGKWWGPKDKRPIVALHGWQDSCGTFDKLIPLMPQNVPVLALDLPGHGYSYKLPAGVRYHHSDTSVLLKQLVNYFEWDKISLMGHSLGAIQSYSYGCLFPKDLDFLICLDCVHPFTNARKLQSAVESIEEFIKYDSMLQSEEEPPSYTMEEMIEKLHLATKKSVAIETAECIIRRNIAPSKKNPGKYYFNRDHRVKVDPFQTDEPAEILKTATNVTFPILICKARDSSYLGEGTLFQDVYRVLLISSADCQFHEIPGTHHVHLNEPEVAAHLISKFIKKHDSADRNSGGMKPEMVYDGKDSTATTYRRTDMFDYTFVM